jgi:serine/threonine protein kinase
MKEIKATFDFKGPKDFHKIRILGKGGVGRVYLVQLKGSDKLFAMKVLKQEEMISRNKVRLWRPLEGHLASSWRKTRTPFRSCGLERVPKHPLPETKL